MGEYVYKVTAEIVTDDQGRKANVIVFAYKPYHDGWFRTETDKLNREMRRDAKCSYADRYVRNSKRYTGRLIMKGGTQSIRWRSMEGTISDYQYDRLLDREENEDGND